MKHDLKTCTKELILLDLIRKYPDHPTLLNYPLPESEHIFNKVHREFNVLCSTLDNLILTYEGKPTKDISREIRETIGPKSNYFFAIRKSNKDAKTFFRNQGPNTTKSLKVWWNNTHSTDEPNKFCYK